ncbi:hypothetical protein [Helicobacter sp. T3_23-1059]
MSVQNCVCEAQESISENLAQRLADVYSHKEILRFGKVAYIDSYGYERDGIYEHFLYKNALDFVDLYSDFEKLELGKYCAMVLGMSIDEVELWRHRDKLYEFLDNGGIVVSFCHNYTGILPNNAGYIKSPVEIRDREIRLTGHALTEGVREYDINFRRGVKGFFNRGYFEIPKYLLESQNTNTHCYTEPLGEVSKESTFSCHTEAFEKSRSISNLQDRDISLALNMTNNDRDISVSRKPQYNNADTSLAPLPQYDKDSMDCHEFANANSRNDGFPPPIAEGDKWGGYKPFEIFLRDSEGKCVGYIDRISTNGVILATAGADLLTFGVFENNSARRLGLNLLSWLGNELKNRESNPSLIASATRGERGNPHATNCHTEALAEVSQNNQNRDISLHATRFAQYDNNSVDCHADKSARNDTHPHPTGCEALAKAKTPSLREGVFMATTSHCHTEGEARSISGNNISNNLESRDFSPTAQNDKDIDISLAPNMTKPATNASQSGRFHFDIDTIKSQNPKNPLRKNPTLKNAIITGGASYERNFFYNKDAKYAHFFDKRIYHKDAQNTDFSGLDYIVIASRANPRFLLPCKEKFVEFLKNGGSIVSFGEVTQGYLPNIAWKEYGVNFWWWLSQGADMSFEVGEYGKRLFSKMELFTAKWHYHGAFYPPKDSQMILANELNEAIIYKDTSFKGGLYVTSLDPDFHLGQGFMPKTEPFFDAFMEWIEEDILHSRM